MSKVIYFHVSRVSARIFLSTDFTDYTVFPRDTCDTWRQVNVPHGKQFNLFNLLTEKNKQRDYTETVFLTEEQKGQKLCSFVLMSKVICLHVSRVFGHENKKTWCH